MHFDIITIFPKIFDSYLKESILKRAQKNKLIEIKIYNLRDFSCSKVALRQAQGNLSMRRKIDDKAYGGGPGMVMMAEPIIKAIQIVAKSQKPKAKSLIILFSAAGKQFDNRMASDLAKKYNHFILICGRYEGIDERVKKIIHSLGLRVQELSIGPYVLTGGELPAMTLIDSISRQIPGVLGKNESLEEKRYGVGVPVYTRPEILKIKDKNYIVPKVLLSGNHKKIEEWRKQSKKYHGK